MKKCSWEVCAGHATKEVQNDQGGTPWTPLHAPLHWSHHNHRPKGSVAGAISHTTSGREGGWEGPEPGHITGGGGAEARGAGGRCQPKGHANIALPDIHTPYEAQGGATSSYGPPHATSRAQGPTMGVVWVNPLRQCPGDRQCSGTLGWADTPTATSQGH